MSLIYTSPTSRHNLYLGGKVDAKSLPTLQQRNVKRILNVTPSKEAGIKAGVPNYFENASGGGGKNRGGCSSSSRGNQIQYKRISVYDASTTDMLPYADEIVNFISNGLHHGSVLVHCQRGVSRSATAVMMFLIRKANMTYQQSLQLCQRRRPMVDPISAFCDQLKEYDRECRAFGYLTAVDNEEKSGMKDNGSGSEKTNAHECGHGSLDNNGNKRPINNTGDIERINKHDEGENSQKKRRVAGPAIGPAIGPSRGPSTFPTNDPKNVTATGTGPTDDRKKIRVICPVKSNRPAIGPTMPPSIGPSIGPAKPVKMPIRPAPPEKSD